MIQTTFYRDSDNKIWGFSLQGHAGYAKEGEDIICAAVSALSLNTVNSIEAFSEDEILMAESLGDGDLVFRLKTNGRIESKVLLDALVLGLTDIRDTYGTKYIRIRFEEV